MCMQNNPYFADKCVFTNVHVQSDSWKKTRRDGDIDRLRWQRDSGAFNCMFLHHPNFLKYNFLKIIRKFNLFYIIETNCYLF